MHRGRGGLIRRVRQVSRKGRLICRGSIARGARMQRKTVFCKGYFSLNDF